jgi:hypothetical protein
MAQPTKFSEIAQTRIAHFEIPLLSELMGNTFVIDEVSIEKGELGNYAIVKTDKGIYRTSSGVLLGQLVLIKESIREKTKPVEVSLVEKKSAEGRMYYTFE